MIKGFEEYTHELTQAEIDIAVPAVEFELGRSVGSENAVNNKFLRNRCKLYGMDISGPRMRKIIHVIRVSGKLPMVLANSKGYYVAKNLKEWSDYMNGLDSRINHINTLRSSIRKQGIASKLEK